MMNFSTVTGLPRVSETFIDSLKRLDYKGRSLTQWFKSYIASHLLTETLMHPDRTLKTGCIGNRVIDILKNPPTAEIDLWFANANEHSGMTEKLITSGLSRIRSQYDCDG